MSVSSFALFMTLFNDFNIGVDGQESLFYLVHFSCEQNRISLESMCL